MTEQQAKPAPQTKTLAMILGGAAIAAAALAFTGGNEGVSLVPYRDSLGRGVSTVCFGDTVVEQRRYTLDECLAMLDPRMVQFADPVRSATPGFDGLTAGQKIAVVDFAYNVGVANYKASALRQRYAARQFPAACDEYLRWRYTGKPKRDCSIKANGCSGIWTRRQQERAFCRGEKFK